MDLSAVLETEGFNRKKKCFLNGCGGIKNSVEKVGWLS